MTTTDMPTTDEPRTERRLRRSRTDRVGAGVAAGLGEYFRVDPVLFRVLFATSAFFGGTGVLAYLLAWAAIPEQGTERAPIDGWVGELRSRRIPPWVVAVVGGLVLWGLGFSWWAPGPFFAIIAVAVVLVIVFGRREMQAAEPRALPGTAVDLVKRDDSGEVDDTATQQLMFPAVGRPTWVDEVRAWVDDAKAARRLKRRRALPVKIATLGTLVLTLAVLGIVDSVTGVDLSLYFWTSSAIVVAGLVVGAALRRAPWSIATLLPVLVAGSVAFAGSGTRFGDGVGERVWKPTTVPAAQYRLAFGHGVLDLSALPSQTQPRTVDVRLGAGKLSIIVPPSANVIVEADVHIGRIVVGGGVDARSHSGVEFDRTIDTYAGGPGAPITVRVHLTDGLLRVGA